MSDDVKPCEKCGRELRHVRTLSGPMIRNGEHRVWTHTDTGYAPCDIDANGVEIWTKSRFVEEVLKLSKEAGYSIEHEDRHGGFVIKSWSEEADEWLRSASDGEGNDINPEIWEAVLARAKAKYPDRFKAN